MVVKIADKNDLPPKSGSRPVVLLLALLDLGAASSLVLHVLGSPETSTNAPIRRRRQEEIRGCEFVEVSRPLHVNLDTQKGPKWGGRTRFRGDFFGHFDPLFM